MLSELVVIRTRDNVDLDGALYSLPSSVRLKGHWLLLHKWNFYRGTSRWLPVFATANGYECLSMNFRDHDTKEDTNLEERLDASCHDLRAGIDYLYRRGATEVTLFGHGYANNKLACYPALAGDDRARRFVLATLGAVKETRPDIWKRVLAMASEIRGDVFIVQGAGDTEIKAQDRADEFAAAAVSARVKTVLLQGANHYFDDRHNELWNCIAAWLDPGDPGLR